MRRHFYTAFVTAICAVPAVILARQAQPLPLVVERTEVLAGHVVVSVHNPGPRTIVAWGVRTFIRFADGTSTSSAAMTDGYEADLQVFTNNKILKQDERSSIRTSIAQTDASRVIVGVSAAPIVVIFDDQTALGDEGLVKHLFRRRAQNQRLWRFVEAAIADAVSRAADAASALRLVDASLDNISDADLRNSTAYPVLRQTIALALDPRSKKPAGQVLGELAKEATARRQAAELRSQRR